MSDTHNAKYQVKLQIPECDVLVHTGDIGGRTNLFELTEFLVWFEKQPARKKIFIAGNHDIVLDKKFANKAQHDTIQKYWARIPSDVDVLLTHTPAYGILDYLGKYVRPNEDPHAGCYDLLNVIKQRLKQLKLHCAGHIHENVGIQLTQVTNSRTVLFSNAAVVTNGGEQLITKPLIITI